MGLPAGLGSWEHLFKPHNSKEFIELTGDRDREIINIARYLSIL